MPDTTDRRDAYIDWAIAGLLLGLGLLSVFVADDLGLDRSHTRVPLWAEYVITVAVLLPLAWRRRFPLAVLIAVHLAFVVNRVAGVTEVTASSVALFLALFTAGAQSSHRARDWIRGIVVVTGMVLVVWSLWRGVEFVAIDQFVVGSYGIILNVAFFAAAWLLGDAQRTRRRNERELALRAEQLAAEREDRARRAVLDERVRIARELHDVVAHHVSVMGLQAAGARRVLDADPARAAGALAAVEESGRQAVSELQRLVGFLRNDDAPTDAHPQPTLDDLDQLVAGAGLPARLRWIGRARPVPSSVALSAYRIVQESLTNVLKHAGPVVTTVVVTFATDVLQVEVRNARGAGNGAAQRWGRGLLGMRERVTMLGGRFEHGIAEAGGYRVFAALPTGDAYSRMPPAADGAAAAADGAPTGAGAPAGPQA